MRMVRLEATHLEAAHTDSQFGNHYFLLPSGAHSPMSSLRSTRALMVRTL